MWATGFQPQPWNQQSVMLIGNLLNFGGLAVGQQQNERLLLELIQAGVGRRAAQRAVRTAVGRRRLRCCCSRSKISSRLSDEALELISDLPRLAGSNAWAVAPHRSASGHALLASDPHLEVNRLPSIWYEAVLKWDDHYVMGATLPGCPLFAVARTPTLAWGVTYLKGTRATTSSRIAARGEHGWQYRRGDEWRDFQVHEEIIARKGQEPELLRVYHNELGTLDGDPENAGPGYYLLSRLDRAGDGLGAVPSPPG